MCFSVTSISSLMWVICFGITKSLGPLENCICGEYLINSKREAFIKKGLENERSRLLKNLLTEFYSAYEKKYPRPLEQCWM